MDGIKSGISEYEACAVTRRTDFALLKLSNHIDEIKSGVITEIPTESSPGCDSTRDHSISKVKNGSFYRRGFIYKNGYTRGLHIEKSAGFHATDPSGKCSQDRTAEKLPLICTPPADDALP